MRIGTPEKKLIVQTLATYLPLNNCAYNVTGVEITIFSGV